MARSKTSSSNNSQIRVKTLIHDEARRKNIPTAEYQSIMEKKEQTPIQIAFERRNKDLDPQLVWRGKDLHDWSDLVVSAPPLYIQEKVHPKVIIDDLIKKAKKTEETEDQISLFQDFNGLPNEGAKTEFYQHDSHWSNRMILGDSLQVMASLAEREGLRGKVQCIYFDPPYGIKFNSNFQWSTTSRDVKDGKAEHITREPEQVKAFRDTWRDGIHSYLTYLRDRLTVARDLLSDSGSIFVQIGDENVDKIKALLEEVFGAQNFLSLIFVTKTSGFGDTRNLGNVGDYVVWFAKNKEKVKYRQLYLEKGEDSELAKDYKYQYHFLSGATVSGKDERILPDFIKLATYSSTTSQGETNSGSFTIRHRNKNFPCPSGQHWKTTELGFKRLIAANRIFQRTNSLRYVRLLDDYRVAPISNLWSDLRWGFDASEKRYVVETNPQIVARCLLMASDPGDLVLDPTCGSGTTAYVAEQWGRRWITIDTSRVSLALARARVMGARYPFYILADSVEGRRKEAELSRSPVNSQTVFGSIRQGFVYERVPHITLKSIANNAEIDVIAEKWDRTIEPLLKQLNKLTKTNFNDWDIPLVAQDAWNEQAKKVHSELITAKTNRQKEIDASISAKAEFEYLYDKPYVDKQVIRVAGPFTVESVSPHKTLGVNLDDNLLNDSDHLPREIAGAKDFVTVILENLKTAGVQQAHKEDRISFTSVSAWPGQMICAEGRYIEGDSKKEKRAAIFIGPEFGTVSRVDLVEAAKEAGESDFEVLIACAFNYDARAAEFTTLGKIPILKARMNADLHMAEDLKNTGKGNLFVIFGEPDIEIKELKHQIKVKINGVDVFHPNTGEVKSDGSEGIACWFIDTDYNEESFFVRQAYFLGANDPYKALKSSLKAEIDEDAWESLHSDTSRPFEKPDSGRIAIKVINHLGDEVMKVFKVN